jgi:hypothetical protein
MIDAMFESVEGASSYTILPVLTQPNPGAVPVPDLVLLPEQATPPSVALHYISRWKAESTTRAFSAQSLNPQLIKILIKWAQ